MLNATSILEAVGPQVQEYHSSLNSTFTLRGNSALETASAELSTITVKEAEMYLVHLDPSHSLAYYFFNRLFVNPRARNKGFATKLMDAVVAWADKHHVNIINTVNAYGDLSQTKLIEFYKNYGFEPVFPDSDDEMQGLLVRYAR